MSFHELHLLLGMDVQVGGKKRKATEDPDPEPGDLMHQENFAEDEDFTNTCDTSIGMQQFAAD